MFVSHEAVLRMTLPAARAGLVDLVRRGWIRDASGRAYRDGLAGLAADGPFGDLPVASSLVRVSLLDPLPREDTVVLPLRWEATGMMGRLFPVLDANLVLAPAGGDRTLLTFHGAYRPPVSAPGPGADQVMLHQVASATIRSLVGQIAHAVSAGTAAGGPAAPRPGGGDGLRHAGGQDLAGEDRGPGLLATLRPQRWLRRRRRPATASLQGVLYR